MDAVIKRLEQLDMEIASVTVKADIAWEAYESAADTELRANRLMRWQQMQDEKKELLAERKTLHVQLTSTGMQQFAEKAAAAKIVGDWLELPEETYFLGNPELGSILYVRKAYRLLRLALRRMKTEGFHHVVVSGNPGVGKTWFAMFMLVWWLKLGRSAIWHDRDAFHLFEDSAVWKISRDHATKRLERDQRIKYVADGVKPIYDHLAAEQSVVAHSPDMERFEEYLKQDGHLPSPLWMPIWDVDELMLGLYMKRGGVPRAVLTKAHDKGTADALEKAIETMTYDDINNIADPYKLKDLHIVAGVHPPEWQRVWQESGNEAEASSHQRKSEMSSDSVAAFLRLGKVAGTMRGAG
ncbi:g3253 [Coccomyxa elongata]